MNKFIEEQLNGLESVDVQQLSETEFLIKKRQGTDSLSVNHYYLIELADYIISPSPNYTLASNWNKGVVPKSKHLKVMVTQILGKMIKVDGIGYDLDTGSDGEDAYMGLWLPLGGIKLLKSL